ncbi:unnamed protein product [Caenorhabditis nigoni]
MEPRGSCCLGISIHRTNDGRLARIFELIRKRQMLLKRWMSPRTEKDRNLQIHPLMSCWRRSTRKKSVQEYLDRFQELADRDTANRNGREADIKKWSLSQIWHADGVKIGTEWMEFQISFDHFKITTELETTDATMIPLVTMQKYAPLLSCYYY